MTDEFIELENALVRAGREFEFPATPDLATRVRAEIARTTNAPRVETPSPNWARVFVPLALALVLALALLFAFPDARDAVAQFLGMRGLRIFYATPTSPPTPLLQGEGSSAPTETPRLDSIATRTPIATRAPTVKPFTLCCETTLADAQKRARFNLLVLPNEIPSKVYYQDVFNNGEQVVMVFGDPQNPRFTFYQAQRWIYGKMLGNELTEHTILGEAQVNGERALWFSGASHVVMMLNGNGEPIYETRRVVEANTLVWEMGDEADGIIYRLETKTSLEDAARFAEALIEMR